MSAEQVEKKTFYILMDGEQREIDPDPQPDEKGIYPDNAIVSMMVMEAIRTRKKQLDQLDYGISKASHGLPRKDNVKNYIRRQWGSKMDKLRDEIKALQGKGNRVLIRSVKKDDEITDIEIVEPTTE